MKRQMVEVYDVCNRTLRNSLINIFFHSSVDVKSTN